MRYSMDMSKEQKKKPLLPEGWRPFKIVGCEESMSKAGNEMFIFTFMDIETKQEAEIYAVSVPKKRWFLKAILAACGVDAAEDGVYNWDIPDVMEKAVSGYVEHEDKEWVNRNNETVVSKKSKITDVEEIDPQELAKVIEKSGSF